MLSEEQYKELVRYRNYDLNFDGQYNETLSFLCHKRYIVRHSVTLPDGTESEFIVCSITNLGIQALEDFECYMRKERAEQERNEKAMKAQRLADRFDMAILGTVSAIIGSVIGGLVVYYWPSIVSFLFNLLH